MRSKTKEVWKPYYQKKALESYYARGGKEEQRTYRHLFLEMYGQKCVCCGEGIEPFLTIEHIQGQVGVKHKEAGWVAYKKAIKEYRPDLYEVRCYNCNLVKSKLGYCPHEIRR
jgi:hypothetical protein